MLADGVYRIEYSGTCGGEFEGDCALAILRSGGIMGSDKYGGVFMGTHEKHPGTGRDHVALRFEIPPFGTMVNGLDGGEGGRTLEFDMVLETQGGSAQTVVEIEGQPLNIAVTYVGPLPE